MACLPRGGRELVDSSPSALALFCAVVVDEEGVRHAACEEKGDDEQAEADGAGHEDHREREDEEVRDGEQRHALEKVTLVKMTRPGNEAEDRGDPATGVCGGWL